MALIYQRLGRRRSGEYCEIINLICFVLQISAIGCGSSSTTYKQAMHDDSRMSEYLWGMLDDIEVCPSLKNEIDFGKSFTYHLRNCNDSLKTGEIPEELMKISIKMWECCDPIDEHCRGSWKSISEDDIVENIDKICREVKFVGGANISEGVTSKDIVLGMIVSNIDLLFYEKVSCEKDLNKKELLKKQHGRFKMEQYKEFTKWIHPVIRNEIERDMQDRSLKGYYSI